MLRVTAVWPGGLVAGEDRRGRALFVLLDGRQTRDRDGIVPGGPVFHPDGMSDYLAWRKRVPCRVRHVPGTGEGKNLKTGFAAWQE